MSNVFFKFITSGASAAGLNLLVFFIFEHIFNIGFAWSSFLSYLISASFHFAIQKKWVFISKEKDTIKSEGVLFLITSLLNIITNQFLLFVFILYFNIPSFLAQFLALCILACCNFFLYEKIIFRKTNIISQRIHHYINHLFSKKTILIFLAVFFWVVAHIPGVLYGTQMIPLHQSYVGDEQSPVNGALHVLQDKDFFALRNIKTLYYGPIFATIAIPGVLADFAYRLVTGAVNSAESYKQFILWDWGGIIFFTRLSAVLVSVLGLIAIFLLARTKSFNPSQYSWLPYFSVIFIGVNFYYFEYSHFFKHWIFIIVIFLWQLYFASLLQDETLSKKHRKYWLIQSILVVVGFGISYTNLVFQIFWIPFVYTALKKKNYDYCKKWLGSQLIALLGIVVVFLWHPYALLRIFRGGATIPFSEDVNGLFYFTKLIILNHFSLVLAFILISVVVFYRNKVKYFMWPCALGMVGLAQFLLFTFQPGLNREGRYMLPVIICFILVLVYVFGIFKSIHNTSSLLKKVVSVLFIFYLAFHVVSVSLWMYIFHQGPVEQSMIQSEIISVNKNDRILIVQYYLAGVAHTKEAYLKYMENFGKSEINLYKQLINSNPPDDYLVLNAYYIRPDKFKKSDMDNFDRVVYRFEPRREINQFDFFDEDLTRLWWYKDLSPQYFLLK